MGALAMAWSRQRLRDLAVETYLWGQRCKWPLPRAARRIVRKVFVRQVDQMIPDRTDDGGAGRLIRLSQAVLRCVLPAATRRVAQ